MAEIITLTDETKKVLEDQIQTFQEQENALSREIVSLEADVIRLNGEEAVEQDSKKKKQIKSSIKALKSDIDLKRLNATTIKTNREVAATKLAQLNAQASKVYITQNTTDSVLKTFKDNNIHYVINGRKWWRVEQDSIGGIRIKDHDYMELKDLVFYSTDWEIKDEMEVKRFAKDNQRFFKDIVRDFTTRNVAGVYNQMDDIRRYWLKPIHDSDPHIAFLMLTLSIAGGAEDYSDQLERLIAYRYVHPEDVMVPNIDSCATGGTGRDTLFNIIRTIFTDECCGEVSEETFNGTHNGDLFGKMWIKVNEQSSSSVAIDKIKAYTGDRKYRDRQMGQDARDVVRLFNFLFFRNGFTTTAKLAGSGSSGEDRRFEPIIARVNLARYVAWSMNLIDNLDQMLTEEQEQAAISQIKTWQREVYNNREEIAKWLGYIIKKHDAYNLKELAPIHGIYYKEMIMRQRKGIDIFMPKFMDLFRNGSSTVISVKDVHKLYEVAENAKVTKDWFKNQMMYWLNTKLGWDCVEDQEDVYPHTGASGATRRRFYAIWDRLNVPDKKIFDINDFIDSDALDEKGNLVGEKINQYSLRDEIR
jgi:hypothetical protein